MSSLPLFTELAILLAVAAGISIVMRLLKQPLVIGHIVTGLLVGPFIFNFVRSPETLRLMSDIGIAFLLFIVGISLDISTIRRFGKIALITGIGQIAFTTAAGFAVAKMLGFATVPSLYLGVALAFSSTIIIMKLISDRGDLERLYAKISIGFLLVQDLVAILLLFFIPIFATGGGSPGQIALLAGKGVLLSALIFFIAYKVLPRFSMFIARSKELLFLFSAAWGMGFAALFHAAGFSIETGALIAGVALSALPFRHEMSARLLPLRDFFIVLFFILLGSQMAISGFSSLIVPGIALSLLVLVGNPLILMAIMGALGYRKKTSLQTGFTVAQISEFSLVLIALGVTIGHLTEEVLALTTFVGLVTIFGSTYLILRSDRIYDLLSPILGIFERKKVLEEKEGGDEEYDVLLVGYNRIGWNFLETLRKIGARVLVVDYDPEVIETLRKNGVRARFGDAGDVDFLRSLSVEHAKLVVSTVPEADTNTLILKESKALNPGIVAMVVAHQIEDALLLYHEGADYVIMPHFLGGESAAALVEETRFDREKFTVHREVHIASLEKRRAMGQEHPEAEGFRLR